jgi:hypothetical protein
MARRRRGPSQNWKFLVGLLVGLAPVIVFGGVDASALEIGSTFDGERASTIVAGEPLFVSSDDARYLNRIFRERSHEIGYCVAIEGDELSFWLGDTVEAGEGSLKMKTSNCPPEMRDATAHTHPSGQVGLSARDEATLAAQEAGVMCIHAAALATEPGARLEQFVCYRRTAVGDPEPVPVRLAGAP